MMPRQTYDLVVDSGETKFASGMDTARVPRSELGLTHPLEEPIVHLPDQLFLVFEEAVVILDGAGDKGTMEALFYSGSVPARRLASMLLNSPWGGYFRSCAGV